MSPQKDDWKYQGIAQVKGITVPKDGEKPQKVNAYIPYGIGKAISVQCLNDFVPLLEKLCK